jgi:hypothetical protein
MRRAPAVIVGVAHRGALDRLAAARTFDGRGVEQQQIVLEPGLWLANTPINHSSVR